MLRCRFVTLSIGSTLLLAALPKPALAQFCFRGRPAPQCAGFALLEFTGGGRLNPPGNPIDPALSAPNRLYLSWSAGYLHNLGGRSALGAAFKISADDDGSRYGPLLRYRRWLGPTWSADLSSGMMIGGKDNVPGRQFPAPTLDLAINWGDRLGLELGLERVRHRQDGANGWDGHVGLRFGTWLAPLATLGLGVLAAGTYN